MKCILCSFDLPSDWPKTKITETISGRQGEAAVCSPCSRRLAGVVEREPGVMTPTREESK